MPTDAQINANRANAQKSTGPRTQAGKAVTRFNALKTGIDAESEVIRGEDPATLAALAADFYRQYQPATPSEAALVDSITHQVWLQRRLRKVEALLWEGERKRMTLRISTIPLDSGEVFAGHVGAFSRIQRRIDSTERNLHRDFAELRRQQSGRLSAEAEAQAEAPAATPHAGPQIVPPIQPEIGSVPHPPAHPPANPSHPHPEPVSAPSLIAHPRPQTQPRRPGRPFRPLQ